jgi:glycosyltransferase involved in cell wall biosynthesis
LEGKKFDIAIDARMINHSGIGTYIKSMIPGLLSNYNMILLGNPEALKAFYWYDKVEFIEFNSPIYSISEQIFLAKKIPACSLFISPHYNIPLLNIKSVKRAVIIHDVNHLVDRNKLSFVKRFYAEYMINAAIRKSDKIITVSEFSKKEIIKYADTKGKIIKVIYCGLDKDEFLKNTDVETSKRIIEKYNLPTKYFLFVGSIKTHKNFKTLINAYQSFTEIYPDIKLVVIGIDTKKNKGDLSFSNVRDKLIFPGYVKDSELALIYRNALCLIFPSIYEGFGLPPLEAMMSGCPVIASNAASIPEVCGDAALYFDPRNTKELYEKMKLIIDDKSVSDELIRKGFVNLYRFKRETFEKNLISEIDNVLSLK